jgi:tetratricopeptide (TPR) repeat protein
LLVVSNRKTNRPISIDHFNFFEANKTLKIAICIFLAVSTFAVYSQVQDHEFINYDDDKYVTNNEYVKAGFTRDSVGWALTTSYNSNWHPMTWLSHMLDAQLFGPNSKGHHLTNLLFHIANVLLLFLVLLRMTGALWQSGFVAALFALHPLNVESVAWVAERKNVLSTFFWLLTMWAYIRYAQKTNLKRYSLVILFFAMGLMSKPMLVTLPFVLLLLDYWPLRRLQSDRRTAISRLVYEKIPLLVLVAGSVVTTLTVQKMGGALGSLNAFPIQERVINALVSYWLYLQKMIWPGGLAIFYAHPENTLSVWKGLATAALLALVTTAAIRLARRAPYFAVGWFWYLGTLIPVIQLVQTGSIAMADRYAYVPLIGIFIIIAWGLPELLAKWRLRSRILTIAAGIWISTLMLMTWNQVSHWKNSITIFSHAIEVTDIEYPDFLLAHNNLANALLAEGRTGKAISHYKMAINLMPDYAVNHNHLANALFAEQKTEEAISHFKMAIELMPDYAIAHNNLGTVLLAEQKTEEAISHYKTAVKLLPDYATAHYNLGFALMKEKKTGEAIFHFKMAIQLEPNNTNAHSNLGNALLAEQKTKEAISHYKIAINLKPDNPLALQNFKMALLRLAEKKKSLQTP